MLVRFLIIIFALFIINEEKGQCFENNPVFEEQVLFAPGDSGIREFRIPSLVTTAKGSLLAVCEARVKKPGTLPNNIDIVMRRSTDGGQTWSPLKKILDYEGWEGASDPSLLVDRVTGTVWLFVLHGKKGVGLFQSKAGIDGDSTCHLLALHSDDDGLTWSKPININRMVKSPNWFCALEAPGRGFQMKKGTLVVPGYYRSSQPSNHLCSYLIYSTDHGKTWDYSSSPAENTTESTLVELEDGRLMLNMRNHCKKGCRAVSYTSDMGKSWSPLEFKTELPDPGCQASMITYETENEKLLLFSNLSSSVDWRNMTVKVSYDKGKTWPLQKTIFKGPSGYSCLTVLPGNDMGLLYEKHTNGSLTFCRFNLSWLQSPEDRKTIVVFGNSTTAWRPLKVRKVYCIRLEENLIKAGVPCQIINSGQGGSHTGSVKDNDRFKIQHARDRFQHDVLDYHPDVVIMQYGINDSYVDHGGPDGESRISLPSYYENLTYMLTAMKDAGIKVVLMTPNPFDSRLETWRNDRLALYAVQMRRVAKENDVFLVDVWKLFENRLNKSKAHSQLLLDGVHPTDKGHKIVADALTPVVMRLLKVPFSKPLKKWMLTCASECLTRFEIRVINEMNYHKLYDYPNK